MGRALLRRSGVIGGLLALAALILGGVLPDAPADVLADREAPPALGGAEIRGGAAVVAAAGAPVDYPLEPVYSLRTPVADGAVEVSGVVVPAAAPPIPDVPVPEAVPPVVIPAVVIPAVEVVPEVPAAAPPVLGLPVAEPNLTSVFGYRINPLGDDAPEFHTGLDYAGACGTDVLAAEAGQVIDSGWHAYGGGQRIVVDHGGGMQTTYNHLSALGVPAGTPVPRGTVLGAIGSTGNSTGCHLHFEVLVDGQKVDPAPWLVPAG